MQKVNQVHHISQLATIPLTSEEEEKLAKDFTRTLAVVVELTEVDVQGVSPTHQVTGLENVLRDDVVDEERMFTQEEALKNASRSHNGYFVVPRILED